MNTHSNRRHEIRIGFAWAVLALALAGCSAGAAADAKPADRARPVAAQPKAPAAATDPSADRPQLDVAALTPPTPEQRALIPVQPKVDTGALPKSSLEACERLCETAMRLKCDGDSVASCENGCRESYALPVCRPEMDAFLACAAQSPRSDWECDPDTGAGVREGVCEREQDGVMKCVQALSAADMPE